MKNVYLIGKNMTPQQIEEYVPERFSLVITPRTESPWDYTDSPDRVDVSIVEVARCLDIDGSPANILDTDFVTPLVNMPLNQWIEAEEIFNDYEDENFSTLICRTK